MFLIILNLICTCMLGLAPLREVPAQDQQASVQYVEEKTRDNYVDTSSGYRQYGTTDLFSYDFLVGLIDYYVNDLGVSDLSYDDITHDVIDYVIQTNNVYTLFYYNDSTEQYEQLYAVSNIVISKYVIGNGAYPPIGYSFTFSNSSPYDKKIYIYWYAQRTADNRLTIWGVSATSQYDISINGTTTRDVYLNLMLSENISTGGTSHFIANIFNKIKNDQYSIGYNAGYNSGVSVGYGNGYDDGKSDGIIEGKQVGDAEGYQRAISQGSTASTIFSGIVTVGLLPVNVLLKMFEYEVFGINIAGLVSGLFTIAIVIIIIRLVTGKKND